MARNTTTTGTDLIKDVFSDSSFEAFFQRAVFLPSATVKMITGLEKGNTIDFPIDDQLPDKTSALTEDSDDASQTMTESIVAVTLVEYGGNTDFTKKLDLTAFGDQLQRGARKIGIQASNSLDTVARTNGFDAQVGVTYNYFDDGSAAGGANAAAVAVASRLTAADVARARAELEANNVPAFADGYYRCIIHPHVFADLQSETGEAGWKAKEVYTDTETNPPISGEYGLFDGFRFIKSSRALITGASGVSGTGDVYSTYFFGDEAIAQAVSPQNVDPTDPNYLQIVVEEALPSISDKYGRFGFASWYALTGFKPLQDESLFKVHTFSSLGAV